MNVFFKINFWVLFFLALCGHQVVMAQAVNAEDTSALLRFQDDLMANGFPELWDRSISPRGWSGIQWDDQGKVIGLTVNGNEPVNMKMDTFPDVFDALVSLDKLESLYLSYFDFKVLPDGIDQLDQVKLLLFSYNALSDIPDSFSDMESLESIYLNYNHFHASSYFPALPHIKYIGLGSNDSLTAIPPAIFGYSTLEQLSLNTSPIDTLPPAIGQLTHLQELDLTRCDIASLPTEIGDLKQLQELKLAANELTVLPSSIGQLSALIVLDVSVNHLTNMPATLHQLTNLLSVKFYSNELTEFPDIVGLPKLKYVDGRVNQIAGGIPDGLFHMAEMEIRLERNNLSGTVSPGKVPHLLYLQENAFQFSDWYPWYATLIGSGTVLSFSPQQKIGQEELLAPDSGDSVTMSIQGYRSAPGEVVKWYRIPSLHESGNKQFISDSIVWYMNPYDADTDGGIYYCQITHPDFPEVTLQSHYISIVGNSNQPPEVLYNDMKFRKDSIPNLRFTIRDDFTESEDLMFQLSDPEHLTLSPPVLVSNLGGIESQITLKDADWVGTDTLIISVTDAQHKVIHQPLIIEVLPPENLAPVIEPIPMVFLNQTGYPDASCEANTLWLSNSVTSLEGRVADDFDEPTNLTYSFDPEDLNKLYAIGMDVTVNAAGISTLMIGCLDTTFTFTIEMFVEDLEGAQSSTPVTFKLDKSSETSISASTIPNQVIDNRTAAFELLDLSKYITSEYYTTNQLTFYKSSSSSTVDLHFEYTDSTVWLYAEPLIPDTTFTETLLFTVHEANNARYLGFSIVYEVLERPYVSGVVLDENQLALPQVSLDGFPEAVFSDGLGMYGIEVPYGWSGTIVPALEGFTFAPESVVLSGLEQDTVLGDFTGYGSDFHEISGQVTDADGLGLAEFQLSVDEDTLITNSNGFFSFHVPSGWSGTMLPISAGYLTTPEKRDYENVSESFTLQGFEAALEELSISGKVVDSNGEALADVSIVGEDTTYSSSDGRYSFEVPYGWSGILTPSEEGFSFDPVFINYREVKEDMDGQDYEASEASEILGIETETILKISPNPARGTVHIAYERGSSHPLTVRIVDLYGNTVKIFSELEGKQEVIWYGRSEVGEEVASGIYICIVMESGKELERSKIVWLR